MRVKLMMHYAGTFFLACLIIVVINILYMRSFVYQEGQLYRFDASPLFQLVTDGLKVTSLGNVEASEDLVAALRQQTSGLQVLNEDLREVYRNGVPETVVNQYSASSLIERYEDKDQTVFVEAVELGGKTYTAILSVAPETVKRTLYTYEVKQVSLAYNIYWLIGMNVFILLMLSYMYTYNVSRPIHRIIQRVMGLSEGEYEKSHPAKGVFKTVEEALNQLAQQLETAQQDQLQAEATREEWISNLSHDIKTPLTTIIGYGELIGDLDYPLTQEERTHYSRVISDKGAYIQVLLSDLNLATRLKHHHLRLKCESVDLVAFVRRELIEAFNDCQGRLSKQNIADSRMQVNFTYAIETAMTQLDSHLFRRALQNLVHNAFIHNPEGVALEVHIGGQTADHWLLTIDDDGVGVETSEISKIFTRYYRGTHTNAHSEGSGLGLAISNDIIVAHGGHMEASRSPRGGLRLTIYLRRSTDETLY